MRVRIDVTDKGWSISVIDGKKTHKRDYELTDWGAKGKQEGDWFDSLGETDLACVLNDDLGGLYDVSRNL